MNDEHTMADAGGRRPTRRRECRLPPVLRAGFRPFFLLGAAYAALAMALWLAMLGGLIAAPGGGDPVAWHRHEMLFGFASAVVAGFILTAIPNWTGRLPVAGGALAGLALLWLAGRMAMLFASVIGAPIAALFDAAFLFVLAGLIAREIVKGSNWRNLPPALLITLLAVANALFHLEHRGMIATEGLGTRLGIAAIAMLIGLIGGRIVPSFTRNWLVKRQASAGAAGSLPSPFALYDKLALLLLAAALLSWTARPEGQVSALLLTLAGIAHMIRLARWRFWRCLAEPLVLILHVGYGWLALGLLLLGLTRLIPPIADLAALHALTAGAFGTMMLAVMTRATLGHSGRPLTADGWTVLIYAAVILGALARVASPLLPGESWLQAAGLLWSAAFLMFALVYGPLLLGMRTGASED